MNTDLESKDESIERAVDLVDRLLITADGGPDVILGEYDASTIIALLSDSRYRIEVMSLLDTDG